MVIGDTTVKRKEVDFIHEKCTMGVDGDNEFIRNMANYLWQKETLANRTVTGKRTRVATGGPLSPDKYSYLKGKLLLIRFQMYTIMLIFGFSFLNSGIASPSRKRTMWRA